VIENVGSNDLHLCIKSHPQSLTSSEKLFRLQENLNPGPEVMSINSV
jgi:hypothetical protein